MAIITAKGLAVDRNADGQVAGQKTHPIMAVPYFAWANRGLGERRVCFPRTPAAL